MPEGLNYTGEPSPPLDFVTDPEFGRASIFEMCAPGAVIEADEGDFVAVEEWR